MKVRLLILSLIAGVFLRLYNINHDNLWIDEMALYVENRSCEYSRGSRDGSVPG